MTNYIPLYRKYRPQAFADLIGQESIVKTLSNAVNFGRISHAYLFTGPRGTGKTSSARILAKSLNCVEGPTVSPCGKCASCIDITASSSVDVIEIDAASNRKVEDARNLLEKVHFVPVAGKYKVYIIDEVHMLTTEAFNTLLKTLEEPPKNLVFILATTESHKVLNTIISRCQRFDFKRVPMELIIKKLKEIALLENIKINDKALSVIAKKAYGGMRDALGLLDQASVLANEGVEITETDILTLFGSLSENLLYEISASFAKRDTINLVGLAGKAVESCEPVNVLRELVSYYKNLLIIKTANDIEGIKHLIEFSDALIPEMKAQSEHFKTDEIAQIIEKLCEYERTIKITHQQQLWLEIALLSICHRQDMQIIRDMEARISRLEAGLPAIKAPDVVMTKPPARPVEQKPREIQPDVSPEPASDPEKTSVVTQVAEEPAEQNDMEEVCSVLSEKSPENPEEAWNQLLCAFKKEDFPSRAFYKMFKPIEVSQDKVVITCTNEKWIEKARSEKLKPLEDAATALFTALPKIIIRTPMPDDKVFEEKKNPEIDKPKIAPPVPKQSTQIAIDVEPIEEMETEVAEQLDDLKKPFAPLNISDQCRMVLDIFQGKIIE